MRGATQVDSIRKNADTISIHAPLAGCDAAIVNGIVAGLSFQSTHPLRGATMSQTYATTAPNSISIHAPHAGCDTTFPKGRSPRPYFNPRTPCGVRQYNVKCAYYAFGFQSTHPLRGATASYSIALHAASISIHAPLAGCDTPAPCQCYQR